MDSVGRQIVTVETIVDKQDINRNLIPAGTRVKGNKRDDYADIYHVTTSDGGPEIFRILTGDEYNPDTMTIVEAFPEPREPPHIYENKRDICIVITEAGLVTHGMPHKPIPVGTKLRGKYNPIGYVENARSEDGTLFKKIVLPSQYREDTRDCSISGGRSKRKKVKKTKRRRSRAKK